MTERRYGDDEVREIFSLATTGEAREQALPVESDGFTLAELQRIGAEAGIDPARVAQAAASMTTRGTVAPIARMFGMPVGVSRVVALPRAPTDREWEQLVSRLRTVFAAQGQFSTLGGLREWSNGNLHVSIEPAENGAQMRLSTRNEGMVAVNGLAAVFGAMSLFTSAMALATGKPEKVLFTLGTFGSMSLIAFVANFIRGPRWVRERDAQFAALAEDTVKLVSDK